MGTIKKYEILDGLPVYGPMYISIPDSSIVSEGYVVRFYKKDGASWVANFEPGETNYSFVIDWSNSENIIVIANGKGYIMTPESEEPIKIFGGSIKRVSKISNDYLLVFGKVEVKIINENGNIQWKTDIISWKGVKNLGVEGSILTGLFFNPIGIKSGKWIDFRIDLNKKGINNEINYKKFYTGEKIIKPWWKIWN